MPSWFLLFSFYALFLCSLLFVSDSEEELMKAKSDSKKEELKALLKRMVRLKYTDNLNVINSKKAT